MSGEDTGMGIRIMKKKIAAVVLTLCMAVGSFTMPTGEIDATGAQTVHVSAAKRSTTSTQTTTTKAKKKSKKAKKTIQKNKKIAKKYVGKKLTVLVKVIGKYKKLTKATSCYYKNEYDGIAKYDGFSVYCHTKNKKTWIVDSVE